MLSTNGWKIFQTQALGSQHPAVTRNYPGISVNQDWDDRTKGCHAARDLLNLHIAVDAGIIGVGVSADRLAGRQGQAAVHRRWHVK